MGDERAKEKLALEGGLKAVTSIEGKGQPKIGVDEFMSIAERFGFSEKALAQIRKAAEADNLGEGPFLPNYYSGLKQTKVEGYEKIARRLFGAKYAIGVNSGTSALHAAFVAAGCDVEAIVLTGEMIQDRQLRREIRKRVNRLAPVVVLEGAAELPALARAAASALSGKVPPLRYRSATRRSK